MEMNELQTLRHSASHILAQAVKRLYPDTKLAIGPAIDDGFYYDFDTEHTFTPEDLEALEKEMKKIAKENLKIERFELPRAEALELMKDEPYKVELINDLPEDATISFYKQGDFVDLCAGPHVNYTSKVKAYKLLSATGAYWRGNEKNKMLQRIYGTAFLNKADLEAHLEQLEEAKKRDHNKLGRELELFTTVDYIGQGLPIMLPKGARVIQLLQRWVEDEEQKRGWQLTKTPLMAKSDLYKISGHWDHYKEGMFVLGDEEKDKEVFALRPMTCPFQYQAFLNRGRSYRDLPMRLNETSTLFRNEASGEMHGLIRVRQFTISEGHLMCTPEQLEEEFKGCLELTNYMLTTLGLIEDVSYRFSKWDPDDREKYIGTEEQWDEAQDTMEKILKDLNIDYKVGVGEAAFYGPKLDVNVQPAIGNEITLSTCQLDFCLPAKFNLSYIDSNGEKQTPVVLHRAILGSLDRFMAYILEETKGNLPTWLAPVQARVMPVKTDDEGLNAYAQEIVDALEAADVRVELDDRAEKLGYRMREGQVEKVPYLLVVGFNEKDDRTVSFRLHGEKETTVLPLDTFVEKIKAEIKEKSREHIHVN